MDFFRHRETERVRLVRACGSKQGAKEAEEVKKIGQARKSLWIETI